MQARPWPNGLGITRDIFARNRSDTGFDWLISVADLVESAAFSHFPGVDRIFTLIEGDDVALSLDSLSPMACKLWVPASFPGDRPTLCTMGHTKARAFNLFIDRDRFDGQAMVRTIAASHAVRCDGDTAAVYCVAGTLDVEGETLSAGDTIVGTGATTILAIGSAATAIIVGIASSGQNPALSA